MKLPSRLSCLLTILYPLLAASQPEAGVFADAAHLFQFTDAGSSAGTIHGLKLEGQSRLVARGTAEGAHAEFSGGHATVDPGLVKLDFKGGFTLALRLRLAAEAFDLDQPHECVVFEWFGHAPGRPD